jgi:hypothetical protein
MRDDRQTSGNWAESGHGQKRRMGRNKRKGFENFISGKRII